MVVENFEVAAAPSPGPLADLLRAHGASVVFTAVVHAEDRLMAHVRMPADPDRAGECRQMIEDWPS